MDTLEIEVKFFLQDVEAVRNQLRQTGIASQQRVFERNICFETAAKDLFLSGSLLRLRKDNKTTLTYKTQPPENDPEFKVLRELEVTVSDFKTMQTILGALGFQRSLVYEKYRETYTVGSAYVCVDCMPFGNFIEIEGRKNDIRTLARKLGMAWRKRIVLNYRSMFETIKQQLDLPFYDITFENFKGIHFDILQFLPLFETGFE